MSTNSTNLNKYYYQLYKIWGQEASRIFQSDVIPINRQVDRDTKGFLLTPYERQGYHINQNADN